MKHDEIERYRKALRDLVERWHPTTEPQPEEVTKGDLQELARKVGASTRSVCIDPKTNLPAGYPAGIGELIDNIHQALQTASMIDACRTAARNFWIALAAVLVSLVSAVAAWVAVCRGVG